MRARISRKSRLFIPISSLWRARVFLSRIDMVVMLGILKDSWSLRLARIALCLSLASGESVQTKASILPKKSAFFRVVKSDSKQKLAGAENS